MAFGNIARDRDIPVDSESLTSSTNVLRALTLGRNEVQSYIDGAMRTLNDLNEQIELVSDHVAKASALHSCELESLKHIAYEAAQNLDYDGMAGEWALYHVAESCAFLLGEEVEMENGDIYRDGALSMTHEQSCEASRLASQAAGLFEELADAIEHDNQRFASISNQFTELTAAMKQDDERLEAIGNQLKTIENIVLRHLDKK